MRYKDPASLVLYDLDKSVAALIKLLLALLVVLMGAVGFIVGFVCGLWARV